MTVIGKIYTYANNVRAYKSLIAAKYAGVEVEVPPFTFGVDNQTEDYKRKFPSTAVPAFEGRNGEYLFESNAIARFVLRQTAQGAELLGRTALEEGLIAAFVDLLTTDLVQTSKGWLYPIQHITPFDAATTEAAKAGVKKTLLNFDRVLESRTYLVGERVTLADIIFVCSTLNLYKLVLDPEFRAPFPNVTRYFNTLVNQPNFKAVLGDVQLCEKMAVYEPKKEEKKVEKKEEKKKEKPAAKPKEEEAEEEEEVYEEKPKEKNPLDLLPPSTFSLETWKRFYSNNDEQTSIKYFWENLDKEGFSVYFADYKDNPIKGNRVFMTCNLVGGGFQRMEEARKYAFGSYIIFGQDGETEVHGFWVFRGPDIPREVRESPDFESYDFTRANLDDQTHRERINAFLAWKEIDGVAKWHGVSKLNFAEGKIYK